MSAGEAAPSWEDTENASTPSRGPRRGRKRHRFIMREGFRVLGPAPGYSREEDPLRRARACGRIMVNGRTASVQVERESGEGRYRGLMVCGSIHVCPVCSATIRYQRSLDIEEAGKRHLDRGGHLVMVTLTTSHRDGMALAGLWDAQSKAMRYLRSGRAAKALNERLGLVGTIRAVEVTVGPNGWHPHVHILLFVGGEEPVEDQVAAIEALWGDRWRNAISRQGYPPPEQPYGVVVQPVNLAEMGTYLAKVQDAYGESWGPGQEIARSDLKSGRAHGRTPFEVLEDWLRAGSDQDLARWREWETASLRRRAIVWSNGLRKRLGMDDELEDQEVAEGAAAEADTVYVVTVEEWRAIQAARVEVDVLEAAEDGRTEGVRRFLADLLHLDADQLACGACTWGMEGHRVESCARCRARLEQAAAAVKRSEEARRGKA